MDRREKNGRMKERMEESGSFAKGQPTIYHKIS